MSLALALLLPFAGQVGPGGALPQAPIEIHHRKPQPSQEPSLPMPQAQTRMGNCLALAQSDPLAALDVADEWAKGLTGAAHAEPKHCQGVALSRLGRWAEAELAFREARDDTPVSDRAARAARGAMAGNAALAAGSADRALASLDIAHTDALSAGLTQLTGEISIDRARALVGLGRLDEAGIALAEARANAPDNPQAWLLSATLARRQGKLEEAQAEIEVAARLLPVDPEIGLEAGVIAVLSGRDEAARLSWESVIAAAPDSDAAKTAKSYLDQLGPPPPPSGK